MNIEARCITYKVKKKKVLNEWENDDSGILQVLYSVYNKIRTNAFPYLLGNLFKHSYVSSVKIYKYLTKFIS